MNKLEVLKMKLKKSMEQDKEVLTREMLQGLKAGDKVIIHFNNNWAQYIEEKATVHSIEGDKVTLRKYRSKTQGWILEVGQIGSIEKGWNRQTA